MTCDRYPDTSRDKYPQTSHKRYPQMSRDRQGLQGSYLKDYDIK